MKAFTTGVGILLASGMIVYAIRYVLGELIMGTTYGIVLVTGTTYGTNIMAYIVPFTLLLAILAAVLFAWFKKKRI